MRPFRFETELEVSVPARILLVDDHSQTRTNLRSLLSGHAIEIYGEAENGLEALARVRERQHDPVVLDQDERDCSPLRDPAHRAEDENKSL